MQIITPKNKQTTNRQRAKEMKGAYVAWEMDLRHLSEEMKKAGHFGTHKGNKVVTSDLVQTDLFRVALFLMFGVPLDDPKHAKEGRLRCMGLDSCAVFKGPVCGVCRCCRNCASAFEFAPNGKKAKGPCPGCKINPPRVRPKRKAKR